MRKVTQEIARAFANGERRKIKATECDGSAIYLHGNRIVWRDVDDSDNAVVCYTLAGWNTMTTRDRLNGIAATLGHPILFSQRDFGSTVDYDETYNDCDTSDVWMVPA